MIDRYAIRSDYRARSEAQTLDPGEARRYWTEERLAVYLDDPVAFAKANPDFDARRTTTFPMQMPAYGHVPAIRRLKTETDKRGLEFKILDDRDLETLEDDFLPGMLIEIRVPLKNVVVTEGEFKEK